MQRMLCMLLVLGAGPSFSAIGADNPLETAALLKTVDRTGRVTDAALRERTGIVKLHAYRWAIERKLGKNRFETASPKDTFHTGDEFRLRITAYTDMYFYLVIKNADGTLDLLLPEKPGGKARLIRRAADATIPEDHTFEFTGATGREELKILASPKPLPWRMARQLIAVRHGQKLRSKQQAALSRLKTQETGDRKTGDRPGVRINGNRAACLFYLRRFRRRPDPDGAHGTEAPKEGTTSMISRPRFAFALLTTIVLLPDSAAHAGERWALLIGADQYAKVEPLRYAGSDTDGLYTSLRSMGFDDEHIRTLNTRRGLASLPLKNNIVDEFDNLFGTAGKEAAIRKGDLVLIVFSGHGVHIKDQGSYLCPVDVRRNDPRTMISVLDVFSRLQKSPARQKLFLVDACRNQVEIQPGGRKGTRNIRPKKSRIEELKRFSDHLREHCPAGVVMMTSCKPGQYSHEDDNLRHGVFLNFILKGLDGDADTRGNGATGDGNGRVSLKELFDFARAKTRAYVRKRFNQDQEPGLVLGTNSRDALRFEFESYNVRFKYTMSFQVRVGGPRGRVAADAKVQVSHRLRPQAAENLLDQFQADGEGRGMLTLKLNKQQRTAGSFFARVTYRGETATQELKQLLLRNDHELYAPESTPLDDRVKQLYADSKFAELMDLVWGNWNKAAHGSKVLFAKAARAQPEWWLLKAESLAIKETDPATRGRCWGTIARGWHRLGESKRFDAALEKMSRSCSKISDGKSAVDERLRLLSRLGDAMSPARFLSQTKQIVNELDAIPTATGRRAKPGEVTPVYRHHIFLQLAGMCHRRNEPNSANHYLKLAVSNLSKSISMGPRYTNIPAYAGIIALARSGDLTKALRAPQLSKPGEVLIDTTYSRRDMRAMPVGSYSRLHRYDRSTKKAPEIRVVCELALAAAKSGDRRRFDFYDKLATRMLPAPKRNRFRFDPSPGLTSQCRDVLAEAKARRLHRETTEVAESTFNTFNTRFGLGESAIARLRAIHCELLIENGKLERARNQLKRSIDSRYQLFAYQRFMEAHTADDSKLLDAAGSILQQRSASIQLASMAGMAVRATIQPTVRSAGGGTKGIGETGFTVRNLSTDPLSLWVVSSGRQGRVVMMTSCKAGQFSMEDEDLRHGVFLNFLLKGLDGDADRKENGSIGNANGRVSLKELFEYARSHTAAYVSKRYQSQQDPELKVSRKNRVLLDFEFGPYSARYPYTLEFQVRVNGPSGRVATGAKVDIFHQASPRSALQRLDGFRADGDGKGQLILRLDKRQRTSGTFVADIEHRGARARQTLRELLERTRHHLYAPETTPYAERVEALFKAEKYHELLDLVWKNWAKSSKVIRDRFVVAMRKKPDWMLLQAEKEVARESRPEFAAAAWAAIARQWKTRGDVARFQAAIRQVNAKCLSVDDLRVAVRLRLAILEDLAPILTGTAADNAVYLEMVRLVKVSTDTIPAAGRNTEDKYLRHRSYVRLAAISFRRGSVKDANYYLKLAYTIIHPAGAFYWDLPAYACMMTRLRADDLDSAMKYPHLNPSNGQVRLYMLSGQRGFMPLERIPALTQHMKLNLRDSESAWEARLTCELARAFAARGAALRRRARINTTSRTTLLRDANRLYETALKYERLGESRLKQLKHTSRPSVSLESRRLLAEATAYRLFLQGAQVTEMKIAACRKEVADLQPANRRPARKLRLDRVGLARMLATHGRMLVAERQLKDAAQFLRKNSQRWHMLPVLYSFGRALRTETSSQLASTIDWANSDAGDATRASILAGLAVPARPSASTKTAGVRAFSAAEALPSFRVENQSSSRLYILLIERAGETGKRQLVSHMHPTNLCLIVAIVLLTASDPVRAEMAPANAAKSRIRRFALLVGIDHYGRQTGFESLQGAVNDVANLQHVLTSEYGFHSDDVVVLLNDRATATEIAKSFCKLSKRIRPQDLFVFYFSGHGTQLPDDNGDEKEDNPKDLLDEAIVPFDARRGKSGIANLIRDDRLGALLDKVPARHQVAIFDCCHSGTGTRTLEEGSIRGSATDVAPADSGQKPNDAGGAIGGDLKRADAHLHRVVLSACAARQRTREVPLAAIRNLRIGLFTYYLVEGLRGAADVNGDGCVSYAEAHQYVQRRIHDFRNDGDLEFQHQQTPQLEIVGPATFADDPVFAVKQKVPMHTPVAVRDGFADLAVGAIHGVRRGQILGLCCMKFDIPDHSEDDLLDRFLATANQYGVPSPEVSRMLKEHPELEEAARRLMPTGDIPDTPVVAEDIERAPLAGGTMLGEFRIVRQISRGGMGIIYEAVQTSLDRRVALKTILPHKVSDDARRRFERERQVLARLHESHIIPIYAAGTDHSHDGGLEYFAMPYIHGRSLRQAVDSAGSRGDAAAIETVAEMGSTKSAATNTQDTSDAVTLGANASTQLFPHNTKDKSRAVSEDGGAEPHSTNETATRLCAAYFESVARFMRDLAMSLQRVHDLGVVHRDLTPANILIDGNGQGWLIDFGLAHLIDEGAASGQTQIENGDGGLTGTSTVAGTLRYMAPEQYRGQAGPVTDIWGIGTAFYELLTLAQFAHEKGAAPSPPREQNPHIPRSLEAICLKAVHPDIGARYGSATELADDLTRWLKHEPVVARRYSRMELGVLWSRRNPAKAIAAAALFVVAATSFVLMRSAQHSEQRANSASAEARQQEREAKVSEAKARRATEIAVESERDARVSEENARKNERLARTRQAEARVIGGDMAAAAGQYDQAWRSYRDAFERYQQLEIDPYLLMPAIVGLSQKSPPPLLNIKTSAAGLTDVSISADGKRALVSTLANTCQLVDLQTGRKVKTFGKDIQQTVLCHALSPDGTMAVTGSQDNTIRLWNVADGKLLHTFPKIAGPPTAIRFSGDGQRLFVGIGTIGAQGGGVAVRFSPKPRTRGPMVDGRILVWDVTTKKELANLRGHLGTVSAMSVSKDGRHLVSGSHDMTVRFWDVDEAKVLKTFSCKSGPIVDVMLAPDARMAVAVTVGGKVLYCDLVGGQSQESEYTMYNRETGLPMSATIMPDFSRVLMSTRDGNARLFGTPPKGPHAVLTGPGFGTRIGRVRFVDADIALTGSDGRLLLWGIRRNPFVRSLLPLLPTADWRIFDKGRFAVSLGNDRVVRLSCLTSGRVVKVFEGDAGATPRALAINADRQALLTGGQKLKLWSTRTGQPVATLPGHTDAVESIAISADGKLALSGSADGTARLWDLRTRKSLRVFNRHDPVDPKQKRLRINMVQIGSRFVRMPPDPDAATAPAAFDTVLFSPDSRRAFTKSDGAWIWDVATGRIVARLDGKPHELGRLWSFSSDGRLLLSWRQGDSAKQEVLVWNAETGKLEKTIPLVAPNAEPIVGLTFSPDDNMIVVLRSDGLFRMLDRHDGRELLLRQISPRTALSVRLQRTVFSKDRRTLIVQDTSGLARVFDLRSVQRIVGDRDRVAEAQAMIVANPNDQKAKNILAHWYTQHQQYAWAIDMSKNAAANDASAGQSLLRCYIGRGRFRDGDWKNALAAWNKAQIPDDAPERRLENLIRQDRSRLLDVAKTGGANSVVVASGDRKSFLVSGERTQAYRLRMNNDRLDLRPALGLNGGPLPVTGDGNTILAQRVVGRTGRMALFDISREIAPVRGRGLLPGTLPGQLRSMVISSDGKTIAAGFDRGSVMIWSDNRLVHTVPAPAEHVTEARKVDSRLGKWLKRLEGVRETLPSAVSCLAFHETRNLLLVGYSISGSNRYPGYVQLIDAKTGKVLGGVLGFLRMLCITREKEERLLFPQISTWIKVLGVKSGKVRLGIDAPREVTVFREEIADESMIAQVPFQGFISRDELREVRHLLRNRLNAAMLRLKLITRKWNAADIGDLGESLDELQNEIRGLTDALAELDDPTTTGSDTKNTISTLNSRRVLVVEDDRNECDLLAGFLRHAGLQVNTANDGDSALQYLARNERPDVVIMDMIMPRCDGPTAIKRIRCDPSLEDLKIFAVSGCPQQEIGAADDSLEVDRWFRKPLDPEVLLADLAVAAVSVA
eukprot:g8324.t1